MLRPFPALLWLLAVAMCCMLPSCAMFDSGRVGSGDRTFVRLYDTKNDLLLELANSSHPDFADIYSTTRSSATLKLADDEALGDLLDAIDRSKFPQLSQTGSPSSMAGVRGLITVDDDGDVRTFTVPPSGATADQLETFVTLKQLVAAFYQGTGGLQAIDNPAGSGIFRSRGRGR